MNSDSPRRYHMTRRAESATATAERILDAAVETFWEGSFDLPLHEVARRAGVSVQTVIRRFDSKEKLLRAAGAREAERIARQRDRAPEGDATTAFTVLLDHYEEYGEAVVRMLANEDRFDGLREIADRGRSYHEAWCARVFADALRGRRGAERKRRLAQLIALTDVSTWKLLRLDRQLSRRQTEIAMRELVEPLLGGA